MEETKNAEDDASASGEMPAISPPDVSTRPGSRITGNEYYDEITEYMRQVDEILDFIKPFPRGRGSGGATPRRQRSQSQTEASDHLENLIKLVEQLKDLKERDSKMTERGQYLKDLKKLRERKRLLKYEAELGSPPAGHRPDVASPEVDGQAKKCKSSSPFRKAVRGRSKSVNMDDFASDGDARLRRDDNRRRKFSVGSQKADKSKVSKWTKVKEAFRWEKASDDGRPGRRDESQFLQVPQDKTPESLSDSPLSGQVSGSSSVGAPSTTCLAVSSGYSGEHSSEGHSTSSGCGIDAPAPLSCDDDFLSLPLIQDMSSSSSSEKLDELLTYSKLLSKGNDKEEMMADSLDVAFHRSEEVGAERSKSLDGDVILEPSRALAQHLTKESLSFSKTSKTHKTTWGKVKGIIQTRKDSLKKKPKKRNCDNFHSGPDPDNGQDDPFPPEDKSKESIKPRIEVIVEPPEDGSVSRPAACESISRKRLTPMLTITLPSTEELRSISSADSNPGSVHRTATPVTGEDRGVGDEFFEDIPKYEKSKSNSYHRFSKWSKVKRAFLTNPSRSSEYAEANSTPSSPNKQVDFFSDVDSDELSSGEWTEEKAPSQEKGDGDSPQDDVQRRSGEQSQKISFEYNQKSGATEKRDGHLRKQKSEDWEKMTRSPARQRESMSIPLPKLDDLSPEFKKKLDEWKKMKKSQTICNISAADSPKDETQGPNFKMRIGEWQRWRPRSGHKMSKSEQSEEFAKKLEEWQRMKESGRRSRSQSDRGKDESGNRTPSPGIRRKNSKGAFKKTAGSGKSSGTESLSESLREKESRKQQKEKDLQWLEKELHKIERGKLRLEREKEKFLEREARLEKMKRTMGTTSPTQEVLIKTPTGFFRFEGISQKFTKKLYEWEKARGIAPEASTFALLEECAKGTVGAVRDDARSNGPLLQRSKSVGSVMEASSVVQGIPHHPSSLSLNDVDDLNVLGEADGIDVTRESSEPTVTENYQDDEEPQAIIVDVEDVVEETAALMTDVPIVKSEVPVYSYAPTEVTRLVNPDGRDGTSEANAPQASDAMESAGEGDANSSTFRKFGIEPGSSRACRQRDESAAATDNSHQRTTRSGSREAVAPSGKQQEAVGPVHELSSQLLPPTDKMEVAAEEKGTGDGRRSRSAQRHSRWKQANPSTGNGPAEGDSDQIDSGTSGSAPEVLSQLPSLRTDEVLELKYGPNVLGSASGAAVPGARRAERFPGGREFEKVRDPEVREGLKPNADPEGERSPRRGGKVKTTPTDGEESVGGVRGEPSRGLDKSKAQTMLGDGAECEYERSRAKDSPETIKRKIREKISLMQRMTMEGRPRYVKPPDYCRRSCDEETPERTQQRAAGELDGKVVVVGKNGKGTKQKKLLKTRRITDTTVAYQQTPQRRKGDDGDDVFIDGVGKWYSGTIDTLAEAEDDRGRGKTPVNVFVQTTRKIISPVRRDSTGTPSYVLSYVIDDISPGEESSEVTSGKNEENPVGEKVPSPVLTNGRAANQEANVREGAEKRDIGIPPLPNSPTSPRKLPSKETAPSIRLMIAKYNQNIEKGATKSTGTSSPVSWRSPLPERRPMEQQPEKTTKTEIQKSASTGLLRSDEDGIAKVPRESSTGILKSSSLDAVKNNPGTTSAAEVTEPEQLTPSTLRALRLKRAKEEFLSRGPGGQSWTSNVPSPATESAPFDANRLSHLSIGSESSFDEGFDSNLIKSASAGTINVSERSGRSSEGADEGRERKAPVKGASKFGISSIYSRFRKARMKRSKESPRMGAVSQLCRQSLLLEMPNGSDKGNACSSKSCPSSPVLERSRTKSEEAAGWMRNVFRGKESLPEAQ